MMAANGARMTDYSFFSIYIKICTYILKRDSKRICTYHTAVQILTENEKTKIKLKLKGQKRNIIMCASPCQKSVVEGGRLTDTGFRFQF